MEYSRIVEIVAMWEVGSIGAIDEIHPERVWRVELAGGESLILKDIGAGEDVARRFAFELDVLQHLDRSGVGVAVPLSQPTQAGREALVEHNGHLYTLSPFLAFEDGWLHLRSSNTEPVMRCIVEAEDEATARKYLARVDEMRSKALG